MAIIYQSNSLFYFYCLGSFLVPLLIIPWGGGGFGYVDLTVLFLPLVVIFFSPKKFYPFQFFLLGFLLFSLVSLIGIDSGSERTSSFIRWVRLCAIFSPLLIVSISKSMPEKKVRQIIYVGWVSVFVSIVVSLVMFSLGIEWMPQSQKLWVDGEVYNRLGGLVGNTDVFATSLYIMFALSLYLYSIKRINKIFFIFSMCVVALGVVLSSSRMAFITIASIFLSYSYFSGVLSFKNIVAVFSVTVMVLLASGGLLSILNQDVVGESMNRFSFYKSDGVGDFSSGRIGNWLSLLENLDEYLILGEGYKNGDDASAFIDNSYLRIYVETGGIGLVCYMLIFASIFIQVINKGRDISIFDKSLSISLVFALLISGMTSDIYTYWATTPIVLIILASICHKKKVQ